MKFKRLIPWAVYVTVIYFMVPIYGAIAAVIVYAALYYTDDNYFSMFDYLSIICMLAFALIGIR